MSAFNLDLLKRPVVIVSLVAIVLLLGVWWFAWMSPESGKLSTLQVEQQQNQVKLSELNATLAALKAEQNQVKASQPFVARFVTAIPPEADQPQLFDQLVALATKTGVSLGSVSDNELVPGAVGASYSTIPVAISVSGPHSSINGFISGLYKLPRLITISALSAGGPTIRT